MFDKDGSGTLNVTELRRVMSNMGERLGEDEIEEMIKEANATQDGLIDYHGICICIEFFISLKFGQYFLSNTRRNKLI